MARSPQRTAFVRLPELATRGREVRIAKRRVFSGLSYTDAINGWSVGRAVASDASELFAAGLGTQ